MGDSGISARLPGQSNALELGDAQESGQARVVLVSGVAGYIGSHVAMDFLEAGWRVIGIDDLSVGQRRSVPAGVEFHQLDCADLRVIDLLQENRVSAALHFAALISVAESVERPFDYFRVNVYAAARFFESVRAAGTPALVFSSTAAVYAEDASAAYSEASPLGPSSPYGRTKLAAEAALRDIANGSETRFVILRYFNVAGADPQLRGGPREGATHLLKAVAEAAVGKRASVTVRGTDYPTRDGTGIRDYIHVSDLASAHRAAVEYLLRGGASETLNCGYGRGYSVRDVIDAARRFAPTRFKVFDGPRRPGDMVSVIADPARVREVLGWVPKHDSLDEIVQSAIEWELATRGEAPSEAAS